MCLCCIDECIDVSMCGENTTKLFFLAPFLFSKCYKLYGCGLWAFYYCINQSILFIYNIETTAVIDNLHCMIYKNKIGILALRMLNTWKTTGYTTVDSILGPFYRNIHFTLCNYYCTYCTMSSFFEIFSCWMTNNWQKHLICLNSIHSDSAKFPVPPNYKMQFELNSKSE